MLVLPCIRPVRHRFQSPRSRILCLATLMWSACAGGFWAELPVAVAKDVIARPAAPQLPAVSIRRLREVETQIRMTHQKVAASCVIVMAADAERSTGASGTIISTDGLILTHCHSGQEPHTPVRVLLGDGRVARAKYLGVHRNFDLALIQILEPGPWPAVDIGSGKEIEVGNFCFGLSLPSNYFKLSKKPLLRMSRVLEVSPRFVYSAMPLQSGDSGGALFSADGKLLAIHSGHDGPNSIHTRADLLTAIRSELLQGKLISQADFWEPIDRGQLASWSNSARRSVVRVFCGGKQVALGLVVAANGRIATKASELRERPECRFSNGRRLSASVEAIDWQHDLALLKVEADDLSVARWSGREPTVGTVVATMGAEHLLGIGAIGTPAIDVPAVRGTLGFQVEQAAPDASQSNPEGTGVVVAKVPFPITQAVVKVGDVITQFQAHRVRTLADFKAHRARFLQAPEALAGNTVELTLRRKEKTIQVRVPLELRPNAKRSQLMQPRFAHLRPDHHGRHSGFPTVFIHSGLAATPSPVMGQLTVPRSQLGGPLLDSQGKVIGINIGSFRANYAYAIPVDVLRQVVTQLSSKAVSSTAR